MTTTAETILAAGAGDAHGLTQKDLRELRTAPVTVPLDVLVRALAALQDIVRLGQGPARAIATEALVAIRAALGIVPEVPPA